MVDAAPGDRSAGEATFPRLLLRHARVRGGAPAMREKHLGIWQTWTWTAVADRVRALAAALAALGFRRGECLAIIGDNRPHLYMMMTAAQSLGGIPVPLYQDAVADELRFVLEDADIRFVVAEDQEQVDKLLEVRTQWPALEHIIYDDPRGLRHYGHPGLHDFHRLLELGRQYEAAHGGFFEQEVAASDPGDVAVILYTSGTTGRPKGVAQTHNALIAAARGGISVDGLGPDDALLSYLPMAWVGDHLFSYAQALVAGFTVNCPESAETALNDLREIGPTFYFAPPRVFEGLLTQVSIRMEDAGALKRWLYARAMDLARDCGADILDGRPVGFARRLAYALGEYVIYGPLKNVLGFSRLRAAYTAGAAIGPDLFRFYRSIGVNLKQLYGQTETCAYVCLQRNGAVRDDTVGAAAPGVELRISAGGEVLVRGPMLLREYHRRPEATAEAVDADGFFHTGDAGFLDGDGQLKIIDRAQDVGRLAGGGLFAPNYIENKLKFFPYIKEAVCFGSGRPQVCAFLNIDLGAVGNWAERRGLSYAGYADLAGRPEVRELLRQCVEEVNAGLARDAFMAEAQIHRFLVLHKELDPDDDELTRTRKVRRNFVAEKYAVLVEALYAGKASQYVETEVKFEDGRRGRVAADIALVEARVFPAARKVA
ncbi:MAG: AMP-binding protein [Dechloromonas sp.]|nr:AMP-binding protein [Dechloromonas sp.]